eukprot:4382182-Pleurochrysis_carterae.AAC.1
MQTKPASMKERKLRSHAPHVKLQYIEFRQATAQMEESNSPPSLHIDERRAVDRKPSVWLQGAVLCAHHSNCRLRKCRLKAVEAGMAKRAATDARDAVRVRMSGQTCMRLRRI